MESMTATFAVPARPARFAWLGLVLAAMIVGPVHAQEPEMIIIAHRGASGERPEHTLAAYDRAIEQGADYIEPDLVPTRDGVLVARHENEISGTTNVADHPEFAARLTTRVIDGVEMTGWFTEDFTLAELRTLRARERLPELRVANTAFDGLYQVPTFAEVIALVKAREAETGRRIGIYPEIKHPAYFSAIGVDLAAMLVEQLHGAGYAKAGDPVFIQSFEIAPLVRLAGMTELPLIQLMSSEGGPADDLAKTYAEMITPEGLRAIAGYADGIGVSLDLLLDAEGAPTGLVAAAHEAGLLVHGWTLRKENAFLPVGLRLGDHPAGQGHIALYWCQLVDSGIDGLFTDDPGPVVMLHKAGPSAATPCSRQAEPPQ